MFALACVNTAPGHGLALARRRPRPGVPAATRAHPAALGLRPTAALPG